MDLYSRVWHWRELLSSWLGTVALQHSSLSICIACLQSQASVDLDKFGAVLSKLFEVLFGGPRLIFRWLPIVSATESFTMGYPTRPQDLKKLDEHREGSW